MPPSHPTPLNWPAVGIVVVAIINIAGWFVVHFLTKRRESQKEKRAADEAAAARRQAIAQAAHLTDTERDLIRHCAAKDNPLPGYLLLVGVDGHGSWVRSGNRDFADDSDPSVQARYFDAFESLFARGFFRHERGTAYLLTGAG